jgi:ATP-binding cassette subfamily B protein
LGAGSRPAVVLILGLTVSVAAVSATEPLLLKYLVDTLGGPHWLQHLLIGVGGLLGICLVREGLDALSGWLTWRQRLRMHYGILDAAVGRLHALSVTFHTGEPSGALMTRLDRGIQGIVAAFSALVFGLLPSVMFLGLSAVLMLRLDWRLSLPLLILAPLPTIIGAWAAPAQTARDRKLLDRWARIYGRFNEVLGGMATVKSFAMEDHERRRFMSQVGEANDLVSNGVGFDSRITAAQRLTTGVTRVIVIGYGSLLIVRGEMTVGTLMAFLGYLGGIMGPMQGLTGLYQTMHRASVSLDAVFSIIDADAKVQDAPGAPALERIHGEVVFDRVCFGYRGEALLKDISLHIAPGETVALVGPSGAGKSTLTALLQRLHDPDSGVVRVDGIDLRHIQQASLRRHIGVVMQDALLFHDTIQANIAYGRQEASDAEIENAARAANAHDFIARLPNGYETEVGPRGARLSAGQRQRIAIARALLKNPEIVILDEATSSLDAESEALVQQALERLLVGRTTVVVAHRLSTVVRADRILVLRDGRINEWGTHADLMASGGYYRSLVELQTRGLSAKIPDHDHLRLPLLDEAAHS